MLNEKINILIVEDESIVALDLLNGLQKDGYNIVGVADNSVDAVLLFREKEPDIILMDINIRGDKDGLDTTLELLKIKPVPVIYLTAYTDAETVRRVKEIQPAAFLTKPFNINNVRIAIELAISNFASTNSPEHGARVISLKLEKEPVLQMDDFIFVKHNYHFIKIRFDELLYIKSENNYVCIITSHKKYLLRLSLHYFLEKVTYSKLVRIHRSYAINIDRITSFNDQLIYIDELEIPIGRNYREDFLKNFNFR